MYNLNINLLLPLLLVLLCPQDATAQCNACHAINSLACYSATQMQACTDGLPYGAPFSCPTNYVCTTSADGTLCQLSGANVVPVCSDCNKCDVTNTFACTGARTFQLCLGQTTPSTIQGSCAPTHVCNIGTTYICGNETEGILPTCSYADDVTTLPTTAVTAATTQSTTPSATSMTPLAYCQIMQQNGRFPYGTVPNTTCRQYINCFQLNGAWLGNLYTCPGVTYFNDTSRLCGTGLPARCTASVVSLRLAELDLI